MAKLECQVCGYTNEQSNEDLSMSEMPQHCGQPMNIIEEEEFEEFEE